METTEVLSEPDYSQYFVLFSFSFFLHLSPPLAHVPPQLQRLVRLVVRAFYQPEHYIVMDILAKYPW